MRVASGTTHEFGWHNNFYSMLPFPKLFVTFFLVSLVAHSAIAKLEVCRIDTERFAQTDTLNEYYWLQQVGTIGSQKVPLVIVLHGGGGCGDSLESLQKIKGQSQGVSRGIERYKKGPCIVVAPQCLRRTSNGEKNTWTPKDLNYFLEHLLATLPVNADRVYLTGVSMGGYGSWAWGGHSPENFAAISPIVGGIGPGGPKDVTADLKQWAKKLASVPVFAFVGALDRVVPAERSERMVAAIRAAGGKQVQLRSYRDVGHNAATVTFRSEEFYEWMFSQNRKL